MVTIYDRETRTLIYGRRKAMKFNQWHPTTLLSMNFLVLKLGLLKSKCRHFKDIFHFVTEKRWMQLQFSSHVSFHIIRESSLSIWIKILKWVNGTTLSFLDTIKWENNVQCWFVSLQSWSRIILQEFKQHEPNRVYSYSHVSFHLIRNWMRRKCISSILIKYYSVQIWILFF